MNLDAPPETDDALQKTFGRIPGLQTPPEVSVTAAKALCAHLGLHW